MTSPVVTYFTVTGNWQGFFPNSSVNADVRFTPMFSVGDVALITSSTPGLGVVPSPIDVKIVNGLLADPGYGLSASGASVITSSGTVRLVASDSDFNLTAPLYYRVEFTNVTVGSEQASISGFVFAAPSTDTTVDLIKVAPEPGVVAVGSQFVSSVNNQSGAVTIGKADVGLGNVDNLKQQPFVTVTAVKTGAYTAAVNQLVPCDAATGAFTVTLPTSVADGSRVIVKKVDVSANAVTVACSGSDAFNKSGGVTSLSLALPYQAVSVQYYSGLWYVTSDDLPLGQLDSRFQASSAALTSFAAGALGTPTSGTLTNCTGLPVTGITASTTAALGVGSLELGNASDTTLSRSAAGVLAVEGVAVPTVSSTSTLTNKRVTPRVGTTTSSATPAINTDLYDAFTITALATAITSMSSGLSGTPTDGQMLTIRFKDNGTGRAITWGTSFTSTGTGTLLTTTVASKTHVTRFMYDSTAAKWACISADASGY